MSDMKPLEALCVLLEAIQDAARGKGKDGGGGPAGKAPADPSVVAKKKAGGALKAGKRAVGKVTSAGSKAVKAVKPYKDAVDRIRRREYDRRGALIHAGFEDVLKTDRKNLQVIAGRYRKLAGVVKATMIAEASIKTANAANDAYNRTLSLPKPFGISLAPVAAGAVVAIGANAIAEISAKKFENGGPASHKMMAELEGGEYVVARDTVAELGGVDGVEDAMEGGDERTVAPVINIRVKGDADAGATESVRAQVRQGLAAFAMGMG